MPISTASSLSCSFLPHTNANSYPFVLKPTSTFLPLYSTKPKHRVLVVRCREATLPVLSFTGETVGSASLDIKSAPRNTARAVVHRALITDRQNARRGTASTLTRGEVRGGGKKPYPQKKTGRARRGSNRTPLRPGGGIIFGPKPRDWTIKINRKEKQLAISTALSSAVTASDVFVVEDFAHEFESGPKTKDFLAAMKRWGLDPKQKALFLMTEVDKNVRLSSRNIGTLKMLTPRTLNLFDILDCQKLVFTKSAVEYLNDMYGVNTSYLEEGNEEEEEEEEEEGEEEGAIEEDGSLQEENEDEEIDDTS